MKLNDHGRSDVLARERAASVGVADRPAPRRPRTQFTVGHLMLAIVVVAYLLAIPRLFYVIAIVLSAPLLPVFAARWLLARRHRQFAKWSFWVAAALINVYTIVLSVVPNANHRAFQLLYPGLFVAVPTIASLGTAWALLLKRDEAVLPRCRRIAGSSVCLMAVLPIVTLWTFWPLRLAFLMAEPKLERLANQVAAGTPFLFPQRAGVFRVHSAEIEAVSHYVGLRVDKRRRPTGFVRLHPGSRPKSCGPFFPGSFDVYLGDGWWYRG